MTQKYTLLNKLKKVEEVREIVKSNNIKANIDVAGTQRELILSYKANPVISNALEGKKSVEEAFYEAKEINKGLKSLIPHFKNKKHNQKVKYLEEIVPNPPTRTYGIHVPDNIVTGTVYGLIGMYLLGRAICSLSIDPLQMSPETIESISDLSNIFPLITGPLCGIIFQLMKGHTLGTLDDAKYIDSKIKEFIDSEER